MGGREVRSRREVEEVCAKRRTTLTTERFLTAEFTALSMSEAQQRKGWKLYMGLRRKTKCEKTPTTRLPTKKYRESRGPPTPVRGKGEL